MDEETKSLLRENLGATRDAIKILKKIQRGLFWQRMYVLAKWGLFVVLLIIGFIQLQPYLEVIFKNYESALKTIQQLNTLLPGSI